MSARPGVFRLRHAGPIAALWLAVLPSAQAQLIEIRWSDAGAFAHQGPIAAGKFVEICGKLSAGSQVQWDYEAGAPVDFNVHYHLGKDVVYPSQQSAALRGKDVLAVKIDQDYCWMWTNKSARATTLALRLHR